MNSTDTPQIKVVILYNEPVPQSFRDKCSGKTEFTHDEKKEIENHEWVLYEFGFLRDEIAKCGFNTVIYNIEDNLDTLLGILEREKPDVIFNCVEVFYQLSGLEMSVAGLYELLGYPITGSPAGTRANCQNKMLAKRIVRSIGVNTPRDFMIREVQQEYSHDLRYPLIAKPALEDSSNGVDFNAVIHTHAQLKEKAERIMRELKQPVLVEEFIDGREINVSVFGDDPYDVLKLSEIDFTTLPDGFPHIVSYQAKWDDEHETYHKTVPVCPAEVPDEVEARFREIAIKIATAMKVRDYTRIDFRLTPDNSIYFLEVNPNPDLSEGAGFMRSAAASGYEFSEMLGMIINLTLKRATVPTVTTL